MNRLVTLAAAAAALAGGLLLAGPVWAQCVTIQDGGIFDSIGDPIGIGYDEWGYNYQAHMFNGDFCDANRNPDTCSSAGVDLMMKWNDAWLSNKDCGTQDQVTQAEYTSFDPDGFLDRHFPSDSYIGSQAWLTNHQSGKVEVNGKLRKWTYFIKIVSAPEDGYVDSGFWFTADGVEIGWVIWGAFAVIEEVSNDPSLGEHGKLYGSPSGPGFGHFD